MVSLWVDEITSFQGTKYLPCLGCVFLKQGDSIAWDEESTITAEHLMPWLLELKQPLQNLPHGSLALVETTPIFGGKDEPRNSPMIILKWGREEIISYTSVPLIKIGPLYRFCCQIILNDLEYTNLGSFLNSGVKSTLENNLHVAYYLKHHANAYPNSNPAF